MLIIRRDGGCDDPVAGTLTTVSGYDGTVELVA